MGDVLVICTGCNQRVIVPEAQRNRFDMLCCPKCKRGLERRGQSAMPVVGFTEEDRKLLRDMKIAVLP